VLQENYQKLWSRIRTQ